MSDEMVCNCDDPNCPENGEVGEVEGHIENCPCGYCHHQLGKI